MDSLVSIAQASGSSAVQEEIGSIIKSTVVSQVQSVMGSVASRFCRDLTGEIKDMGELFAQYNAPDTIVRLQQSAEMLFDSVKTSVEGYMAGRQQQGKNGGGLGGEAGKNIGGTVSTIAGIAGIATNIVAPIVGVVLMLLPQIFIQNDMEVIGKITKTNGIRELYVIPSQIGSSLIASEHIRESGGDLNKAIEIVKSILTNVVKKNLHMINDGGVFDDLIRDPAFPHVSYIRAMRIYGTDV